MSHRILVGQRLIALFVLGWLLFNYPMLVLFGRVGQPGGVPSLYLYLFMDIFSRKMDLGLQVFNLTNHFNPRDVIAVVDSPRFRELTNNPGVTVGGYMQVRW